MARISKKISLKALTQFKMTAAAILKHDNFNQKDQSLYVARIMGICGSYETVDTEFGASIKLKGMFKAICPINGKEMSAPAVYLPSVITDMVSALVSQGSQVEFAFDIFVIIDENSPCGFSYTVETLMQEEFDPMKALESKMTSPLMLAAPSQKPEAKPKSK